MRKERRVERRVERLAVVREGLGGLVDRADFHAARALRRHDRGGREDQ